MTIEARPVIGGDTLNRESLKAPVSVVPVWGDQVQQSNWLSAEQTVSGFRDSTQAMIATGNGGGGGVTKKHALNKTRVQRQKGRDRTVGGKKRKTCCEDKGKRGGLTDYLFSQPGGLHTAYGTGAKGPLS